MLSSSCFNERSVANNTCLVYYSTTAFNIAAIQQLETSDFDTIRITPATGFNFTSKSLLPRILRAAVIPWRALIRYLRIHTCLDNRASVEPPAAHEPPEQCKHQNTCQVHKGIIHRIRRHRHFSGQDEDDADEERPDASPPVDQVAHLAHVPRSRLELIEDELAEDRNDVGPVQGDSGDVKYPQDGGVGAQSNEVDGYAPEDADPYGIQWSLRALVNDGPHSAEGEKVVAGKGEDGTAESLHGGKADELQDDQRTDGEDYAATGAERVVVDLGHRLRNWRVEDITGFAHAKS